MAPKKEPEPEPEEEEAPPEPEEGSGAFQFEDGSKYGAPRTSPPMARWTRAVALTAECASTETCPSPLLMSLRRGQLAEA